MNDKRDFDRAVDRWLDDGSDAAPPGVIDAVLLAARATPQDRDFRMVWSTFPRTTYLRSAAAIVTILVVGAAGLYALRAGPNDGSGVTDTPSAPPQTEAVLDVALHYYADETNQGGYSGVLTRLPGPTRIHARLPDGWVATESAMSVSSDGAEGSLAISFWAVEALFIEPCTSDDRADPPMMQTLDMLAGAFTGWWQGDAPDWGDPASPPRDLPSTTEPVSTTVSGFRARYLEVRVPDDVDTDECFRGRYVTWRNADGVERHHQAGDVSRIWIVEVGQPPVLSPAPSGVEGCCPSESTTPLLVIDATSQGEPSPEGLALVEDIIASLRIEAPSPSVAHTAIADFPVFPGPPRPVDAGIYDLGSDFLGPNFPVSISFVVPAGWLSCANNAGLLCPADGVGGVNIFNVTNVVADPCDETTLRDPSVGPTVHDLVTAISRLPWSAVTPPTDVTVDGFHGTELEVTAPTRSPCGGTDDFATWTHVLTPERAAGVAPGERNRLLILDVQGARVVIAGYYLPGTTSSQDLAEINAIIDSVRIEPQGD